jgi:mannosyltransferase
MEKMHRLKITPSLENSSANSNWREHLRILLPILCLYLMLGFYASGHQSLWEDEYSSLKRVTSSSTPVWKDGHGFLYFALLRLWVHVGTSEVVLRSLSVFFGAGGVCLTYAIGTMLLNRRVTAMGTALCGTSPFFLGIAKRHAISPS